MSDRAQQVQRISRLLRDGLNTALHGGPMTGKSWVADHVVQSLHVESVRTIREDLSLSTSGAEAFAGIKQQLDPDGALPDDVFQAWRELRSTLMAAPEHVCLVLDEFDSVLRFSDAQDFLRLLRELLHRPSTTHCAGLIVSRRTLEAIESEVRGISTLATVCVPEYTRAVTATDLQSVWDSAGDLDQSEIDACLSWSAGHPPLVRYWLSARPDLEPNEHCELTQAIEFQRFVDHLKRTRLDDAAAQLVLGPVVDEWFLQSKYLEMLGVLNTDRSPTPLASHPVFRDCLRLQTLDMDPWGILGSVELALRGLIAERLMAAWGPEWTEILCKRHRGVPRMLEDARPKQVADAKRFGRSGEWLAYTYPQDLAEIIVGQWSHFEEVFRQGDKNYWKQRFDALAMYRTPVAHNRAEVLGDTERAQCRLFAEQILRAIAGASIGC